MTGSLQLWALSLLLCLVGVNTFSAPAPRSVDLDSRSQPGGYEHVLVREAGALSARHLFRFVLRDENPPDGLEPHWPAAMHAAFILAPAPAGAPALHAENTCRPVSPGRHPQSPRAPPLHS